MLKKVTDVDGQEVCVAVGKRDSDIEAIFAFARQVGAWRAADQDSDEVVFISRARSI